MARSERGRVDADLVTLFYVSMTFVGTFVMTSTILERLVPIREKG